MLIDPIAPPRRRRVRIRAAVAPPAALTLTAAVYTPGVCVVLTFDRAIGLAGLHGDQIMVNDEVFVGALLAATGTATLETPVRVRLDLVTFSDSGGPPVRMTASATNGIVGASDGSPWAGVTNLPLPFGAVAQKITPAKRGGGRDAKAASGVKRLRDAAAHGRSEALGEVAAFVAKPSP